MLIKTASLQKTPVYYHGQTVTCLGLCISQRAHWIPYLILKNQIAKLDITILFYSTSHMNTEHAYCQSEHNYNCIIKYVTPFKDLKEELFVTLC